MRHLDYTPALSPTELPAHWFSKAVRLWSVQAVLLESLPANDLQAGT